MTEQRYSYTYHRVLIDSTRILDPQFDGAVIYVTGAQLELLRNTTQYLNRLSTYVSEYHPDYYLSPTIEDYDSICAIVADLEHVLMGNPNTIWGYYDRWQENDPAESVGDPYTMAQTDPVPPGYVYILERFTAFHNHGGTRTVTIVVDAGTTNPQLYSAPSLPSSEYVNQAENLTLKEGDYIRFRVYGLAVGKFATLIVWGHKMKVPE